MRHPSFLGSARGQAGDGGRAGDAGEDQEHGTPIRGRSGPQARGSPAAPARRGRAGARYRSGRPGECRGGRGRGRAAHARQSRRLPAPGHDQARPRAVLRVHRRVDPAPPAGRPTSLVRCPEGVDKECFYQKHVGLSACPTTIRRVKIREKKKVGEYLVVDDLPALIGLVQIGILEIHTWNSVVDGLERPDRVVFDLDPAPDVQWRRVVDAARLLRERLQGARASRASSRPPAARACTSSSPWRRASRGSSGADFTRAVAESLAREDPRRYIAQMSKAARDGQDLHRLSPQHARRHQRGRLLDPRQARGAGVRAARLGRAVAAPQVRPLQRSPISRGVSRGSARIRGRATGRCGRRCPPSRPAAREKVRRGPEKDTGWSEAEGSSCAGRPPEGGADRAAYSLHVDRRRGIAGMPYLRTASERRSNASTDRAREPDTSLEDAHGNQSAVDGVDRLRPRDDSHRAAPGHPRHAPAISDAPRQGQVAREVRAGLPARGPSRVVEGSGQGLRVREGQVRGPDARGDRDRRAREDAHARHPRFRRGRGDRRPLLRDSVLRAARQGRRQGLRRAARRPAPSPTRRASARSCCARSSTWPRSRPSATRSSSR